MQRGGFGSQRRQPEQSSEEEARWQRRLLLRNSTVRHLPLPSRKNAKPPCMWQVHLVMRIAALRLVARAPPPKRPRTTPTVSLQPWSSNLHFPLRPLHQLRPRHLRARSALSGTMRSARSQAPRVSKNSGPAVHSPLTQLHAARASNGSCPRIIIRSCGALGQARQAVC